MSELGVLYDTAVLGKQMESFRSSDVGRYLMAQIDREIESSLRLLRGMNPTDPAEIMRCQNAVWRAESVATWIEEAILAGLKSQEIIEEREE